MNIITGMHRSGTSLVARLVCEAGADFGPPETFYPADKWNPDGYFEQVEFHAINMPLIHGPFGKLAYFHLPSKQTILHRAGDISEDIRRTSERYNQCVVKETWFCLTPPAWLEHGCLVEKLLVCFRNPVMVARSLRRRNRIPLRLGYHMWRIHNERLFENTDGIPIHLLHYEALLDAAVNQQEIKAALDFVGFPVTDAEASRICAEEIHNTPASVDEDATAIPPEVRDLWSRLRERHREQMTSKLVDNLAPQAGA